MSLRNALDVWSRFDRAIEEAAGYLAGSLLLCRTCKQTRVLGQAAAQLHLREGWPQCHGQTMELVKAGPPAPPPAGGSSDPEGGR